MVSAGSYIVGSLLLSGVVAALGFSAVRIRARLLPAWEGAPARLVEIVLAVALLIWLAELLGTVQLLYGWLLLVACLLLAGAIGWRIKRIPAPRGEEERRLRGGFDRQALMNLVALGVVALVVFHWAVIAQHAVNRGIFNFDSLWYHMPFAAEIAQSHSVTGMDHVETVFTNWFYPQNSELLHAAGILLTGRDTLSLFLNFGWLAVAFFAAWCVGRPYGRGHLTLVVAAILLECHTLVVRDPGAAKNDLAAAALLLASIAILISSAPNLLPAVHSRGRQRLRGGQRLEEPTEQLPVGWPLAAAGLATGLACGTRVTVLAMAGALTVVVLVLVPRGRRLAAAAWWLLPVLAGGGYWFARNLIVAGNPVPEITSLGPLGLPHPERLQEGRPDFSIAHYATDTGIWRHYFAPGLHEAFGLLWPVVLLAAAVGAIAAIVAGRNRLVRWLGGVALFGMVAYLFTPLSAAGVEGRPVGFGINIRYAAPALIAGLVLLPLPRFFDRPRRQGWLLAALVLVLLISDRPDSALHDKGRIFAFVFVLLLVLLPAAIAYARSRGLLASRAMPAAGAALAIVLLAIGYPLQRHYLQERFRNEVAAEAIPGMDLDSAYRWARGVDHSRIGLVGTTAGFAGYGFYGTDISNRVTYLGQEGPHGAFNAIPTCGEFRAAVNDARLDYLVTAPFLNFLHPSRPVPSPEARWLRGERAVRPLVRSGPVTVWQVRGRLDPAACGQGNRPLRAVPQTPPA